MHAVIFCCGSIENIKVFRMIVMNVCDLKTKKKLKKRI